MMYKSVTFLFALMLLISCGGSGSSSGSSADGGGKSGQGIVTSLSGSSWQTECSKYNKFAAIDDDSIWNVRSSVRIDSSLQATFKTEFFHPEDTICKTMLFDTLNIINLEVKGKVTTDESIDAYKLNETYIFSSEDTMPEVTYTLVYFATEKLYFGKPTGVNLGTTAETRHSSISLADYYVQKVN